MGVFSESTIPIDMKILCVNLFQDELTYNISHTLKNDDHNQNKRPLFRKYDILLSENTI